MAGGPVASTKIRNRIRLGPRGVAQSTQPVLLETTVSSQAYWRATKHEILRLLGVGVIVDSEDAEEEEHESALRWYQKWILMQMGLVHIIGANQCGITTRIIPGR